MTYIDTKILLIVQARMGSTRLPGKVLMKIGKESVLEVLIGRLKKVSLVNKIIVATTLNKEDDEIITLCKKLNVETFRGSKTNVLERFYQCAIKESPDYVIRVCADSPLIDPEVLDRLISEFLNLQPECDYLSNTLEQTYPLGMNCEIFKLRALEQAYRQASKEYEFEHVTPYIYQNRSIFTIKNMSYYYDASNIRLTIDEIDDLILVNNIYSILSIKNKFFNLNEIIKYINSKPSLLNINKFVKQNSIKKKN